MYLTLILITLALVIIAFIALSVRLIVKREAMPRFTSCSAVHSNGEVLSGCACSMDENLDLKKRDCTSG